MSCSISKLNFITQYNLCPFAYFYAGAFDNFDGGIRTITGPTATAGIFSTYPQEFLTIGNGFADQVSEN